MFITLTCLSLYLNWDIQGVFPEFLSFFPSKTRDPFLIFDHTYPNGITPWKSLPRGKTGTRAFLL
jgi:hypothetical protein